MKHTDDAECEECGCAWSPRKEIPLSDANDMIVYNVIVSYIKRVTWVCSILCLMPHKCGLDA